MLTRRCFAGGVCSALSGCCLDAALGRPGADDRLVRIGVLSDIHLKHPGDETHFLKALRLFRDRGVDGVVVAGDIADTGRVSQLERAAECWFGVFPDDTAPDGRRVERLFVYGNHDVDPWYWTKYRQYGNDAEMEREALGRGDLRAKTWERLFHEPFEPVWAKEINGIRFIGAHWERHCPRIERYMSEHSKDIDPSLPFFYIQHSHPKDTCYGPSAWGHDPGYATRALQPFPNAVAFSGHSHYTLTDERSVWQGAFTSIGASSLRRTSLDYLKPENANGNRFDPEAENWKRRRIMKPLYREDGKQGMVVDVFRDRMEIERLDLMFGERTGDDWIVPLPASSLGPFSFAKRSAGRKAPVFPPGSSARAAVVARAPDCARDEIKGPFVHVTFPCAKSVEGCRPFEYEVRAVGAGGETVLSRVVMAPGFHLPPSKCDMPGECLFTTEELSCGRVERFEVSVYGCFGLKGGPIRSNGIDLKQG